MNKIRERDELEARFVLSTKTAPIYSLKVYAPGNKFQLTANVLQCNVVQRSVTSYNEAQRFST